MDGSLNQPDSGGRMFGDDAAHMALATLAGPYLPWGSGAMRPAGLVLVCNDIVLNDRRRVVELGSGISTVLLARLLTQRAPSGGWRLAAVEHDPQWGGWVTDQLSREGIGNDVVVIEAPLVPHPGPGGRGGGGGGGGGLGWYDRTALAAGLDTVLQGERIDLLVVDGPPAHSVGSGMARYPALPVLREHLAAGATVVLDDVERPGEQEVLRRWEGEFGLAFDRQGANAGVAIAAVA